MAFFERASEQDFNTLRAARVGSPTGIWSDGTTMWVNDSAERIIYAFNLRTKQRDSSKDLNLSSALGSSRAYDIWSDGTLIFCTSFPAERIYVFNLTTKARVMSREFNINISGYNTFAGLWSDGTTIWVSGTKADQTAIGIFAYNLSNGNRDSSKDFGELSLDFSLSNIHQLWSDGTTLWMKYPNSLVAYNLQNKTRDSARDLNFRRIHGAWSNDNYFWIVTSNFSGGSPGSHSDVDEHDNIIAFIYDDTVRKSTDLVKRFIGSQSISKYYIGSRLVWEQGSAPSITALSANPSSIDLDTRATGNVTVTFGVTGSTHNRLYNTRSGANIPLTTGTTAVFAQPQQPTTYRLVSQNATGAVHRDVAIDVTKNPTIANFRRSGFQQIPGGGGSANYRFSATITGLPRPSLGWRFGNGQAGNVSARHFVQGANPYTWTVEFLVTRANANADSLVMTATNSSGSVTATLANINS